MIEFATLRFAYADTLDMHLLSEKIAAASADMKAKGWTPVGHVGSLELRASYVVFQRDVRTDTPTAPGLYWTRVPWWERQGMGWHNDVYDIGTMVNKGFRWEAIEISEGPRDEALEWIRFGSDYYDDLKSEPPQGVTHWVGPINEPAEL